MKERWSPLTHVVIRIVLIVLVIYAFILAIPPVNAETTIVIDKTNYLLTLMEDGETIIEQRVIVGRPTRKTPTMTNKITHVILNPTWTAPKRLARLDVVPKIQKDQTAIKRFGYTFWSGGMQLKPTHIPWNTFTKQSTITFTIVQKAGPVNALGKVKFKLDNPWSIFIHGTPNKRLFDAKTREFSSGCIRVENEVELARYLLPGNDIDSLLKKYKSEKWFKLATPITVTIEPRPKIVEPELVVEEKPQQTVMLQERNNITQVFHEGMNQF